MLKIKNKGFTLIELMVVIAIIGMLSSIVLVATKDAKSKANDAHRISDLHQISLAVELYYSKYGNYPSLANPNQASNGYESRAVSGSNSWGNLASLLVPEFMPSLPIDPTNGRKDGAFMCGNCAQYYYKTFNNNQSYLLSTYLAFSGSPPASGLATYGPYYTIFDSNCSRAANNFNTCN